MKLSRRIVRSTGIAALGGLFLGGLLSNSNQSAPSGYTGSPADGKTCGTNGGCHGGGTTLDNNMISSDIPTEGYTPGTEYNVTITVAQVGISKFGFSFSAQKDDGTQLGTLIAGSGTNIVNTKYMSHKPSSTAGANGRKAWPFKWTAPLAGTGLVSFYATGNAANSMSNTAGDKIYSMKSVFIEKGGDPSTVSVAEVKGRNISIYPNPAQNIVWIESEQSEEVRVINLNGELVKTIFIGKGKNQVDITDLNYGVYRVKNDEGSLNQTLIKL